MTRLSILMLGVFLALPMPLLAAPLSSAPPGPYTMDKSHASLIFRINHLGFSLYQGRFNTLDANLEFDPARPENTKLNATVEIASVDTNNATLEEELRSPDWFGAVKFPTATFRSTSVTGTQPNQWILDGELTMMGVTKPMMLNVVLRGYGLHPMNKKPTLGFGATGTIKRSEWGFTKGVPMVGDDVQLQIEGEFNYVGTMTEPKGAVVVPIPPKK